MTTHQKPAKLKAQCSSCGGGGCADPCEYGAGPRCPACRVPYVQHLGINGICAELIAAKKQIAKLLRELAKDKP